MKIGVVGAGSWGTTLANLLTGNGHEVTIWARESEVVSDINEHRENRTFLPGHRLEKSLRATGEIGEVVRDVELLVSAMPTKAVRSVNQDVREALGTACPIIVSVTKGIETESLQTPSQIIEEISPECPVAVLSGPSFAREVCDRHPTAVVAASRNETAAEQTQLAFANGHFRVYSSQDVLGVELGGALKNVLALAAGIIEGLGLGHNTRAALVTRGLAEITRLGQVLGADPKTFSGLAGLGDLMLTATGALSRNRSLGVELGQGRHLDEILAERVTVAEGVYTAKAALQLSEQSKVELPIAAEVTAILFDKKSPQRAIRDLMERELKAEHWT